MKIKCMNEIEGERKQGLQSQDVAQHCLLGGYG